MSIFTPDPDAPDRICVAQVTELVGLILFLGIIAVGVQIVEVLL